jgi:hypothetical protein
MGREKNFHQDTEKKKKKKKKQLITNLSQF